MHQPAAGGRARVPVDPALLAGKGAPTGLGVESVPLGSRNAAGALASWRLAQNYTALGMSESAAYFAAQARAADPKVAEELELVGAPRAPQGAAPAKQGVCQGDGGSGAKGTTQAPVSGPQALPALSTEALLSDVPIAHISDAMEAGTRTPLPPAFMEGRSATTLRGGETVRLAWEAGSAAPPAAIISSLYQARIDLQAMPDGLLAPLTPADVALSLPHLYYYVIPLATAECHHALGDYASAETSYLLAASYPYINLAVEAPYLWTRLATLYLDWGNSLFQDGQPSDAVPIYANVITPSWQAPTSQLYTLAGLKPGADIARQVIAALPNVSGLAVDPQIIAVVLDVRQELLKIDGNLNYWGVWAQSVPIWTFDYLQQAAVNFTQLAVSAERDVINFWNNADQATLTRQQLSDAADQAKAEVNAQQMSVEAASAERIVYSDGLALANAFPSEHWPKLRSTNPLERSNGEIGRRSDVVGVFPDDRSLIRLVSMLATRPTTSGSSGGATSAGSRWGRSSRSGPIDPR